MNESIVLAKQHLDGCQSDISKQSLENIIKENMWIIRKVCNEQILYLKSTQCGTMLASLYADDIESIATMSFVKAIKTYNGSTKLSTWSYRIMKWSIQAFVRSILRQKNRDLSIVKKAKESKLWYLLTR